MSTSLTIDGVPVDVPSALWPRRLVAYTRGGVPSLTLQARGGAPVSPDPYLGKKATLSVGGALCFSGDVVSVHAEKVPGVGWVRTYQCAGLRNRGDWFPHTDANNLTDTSVYNASQDSQSTDYRADRAGRTVGQILTDVLTMTANAAALDAAGVGAYTSLTPPTLPALTASDLGGLTLVPPAPVYFGGERLLQAVETLLATWAPRHCLWVQPDGTVRFMDLEAFTAHTFTTDTDPVRPAPVSRDVADCFTRVVVRGQAVAEMFLLSLANGGLSESPFAHDGLTVAQAKSKWTASDYQQPGLPAGQALGAANLSGTGVGSVSVTSSGYNYSSVPPVVFTGGGGSGAAATAVLGSGGTAGQVVSFSVTAAGTGYTTAPTVSVGAPGGASWDSGTASCTSTTTVTLTSANHATVVASDWWDWSAGGRHGTIFLSYSAGAGVTQYAQRQVVSNTATSSPGAAYTVTLDRALPITNYDGYTLTGQAGTASDVWRRYAITNTTVAAQLALQSTYPFAFHLANGAAETLTSFPMGAVLWSSNGLPPYSEAATQCAVDVANGDVIFSYPTYLSAGGTPADIQALVPVYVGSNTATYPPDASGVPQYDGTAWTVEGIGRTLTVMLPQWRDPGQASQALAWATELWKSTANAVVEGTVEYLGLYAPALSMGVAVSVAGSTYATGWGAVALPVVECTLDFSVGGLQHVTVMKCSNRRQHYSADAFLRPARTGVTFDWGGSVDFRSSAAGLAGQVGGFGLSDVAAPVSQGLGAMNATAAGGLGAMNAAGDLAGANQATAAGLGQFATPADAPTAADLGGPAAPTSSAAFNKSTSAALAGLARQIFGGGS